MSTSERPRDLVVVGVNGSAESDGAVNWAAKHASKRGLRLLAVFGTGFVGGQRTVRELVKAEDIALEAGRVLVDAAVQGAVRRHPDLTVRGVARVGDPVRVLVEEARGAELLAIGCRHHKAVKRPFGSVSIAVLHHAACPVVVVRPPDDRASPPLRERVILGLDGTAASRDAARFAFEYAAENGLALVIIHAAWERLSRGSSVLSLLASGRERGLTAEEELTIAETIAGLPGQFPEVEFREVHRTAGTASALIEASETARLVVVGATRRISAAWPAVLRSVSTAVAQQAHCPVAVVRPGNLSPR